MAVVAAGCASQLFFISGWVLLGRQGADQWAKWGLVALFVATSAAMLFKVATEGRWKNLLLSCVCLAGGSVMVYQALGFTIFPGLAKDLDFFSLDHIVKTATVLLVSSAAYLVIGVVVRFAGRVSHALKQRS